MLDCRYLKKSEHIAQSIKRGALNTLETVLIVQVVGEREYEEI